jgi:hypothetical protein
VTTAPLDVGFDEVHVDRSDRLSVSLWQGNAGRPVWTYWFPMMCRLSRGAMRPTPVSDAGGPFVYPVELRFETDEWCAEAPADELLVRLPPRVEGAIAQHRVLIVLSVAHEARPLFPSPIPGPAILLDRVAAFARHYGLSADELWFVSGNLDAGTGVAEWCRLRGLAEPPFTLRACEPFSAFVGACTRESLQHGREPIADVSFARRGPHQIGWQTTRVGWTPRTFPGLGERPAPDQARFGYACLNRMFRKHRWEVLTRLWQDDLLDQGLVSFPLPSAEVLCDEGVDETSLAARRLLPRLPLSVDRASRLGDAAFFADNTSFVTLHPPVVLHDCAMEVVTETQQGGCRFVSEKTFKALLGRGPAAVVGTRETLAYLHSLGVRTWHDILNEKYDEIADDADRLGAAMDSVAEFVRRPGWADVDESAVRRDNLRWLTDARKPWDTLVAELTTALRAL